MKPGAPRSLFLLVRLTAALTGDASLAFLYTTIAFFRLWLRSGSAHSTT